MHDIKSTGENRFKKTDEVKARCYEKKKKNENNIFPLYNKYQLTSGDDVVPLKPTN
jgi:hypothetical protein